MWNVIEPEVCQELCYSPFVDGLEILTAFPEECWNTGRNGVIGIRCGVRRQHRETRGLGFKLCVVPSSKSKGVLNLDEQRRQYFHKGK